MSFLSGFFDSSGPSVAVEIASNRVTAASLEWRGGQAVVATHAIEPLPPGALVPSLTTANTHDRASVMTALNRVLEKFGRPRRIALVVPDLVAKVSLVRFEQVPARAQDLDQLVRWQVKKTAPFPIEEAQVTYQAGLRALDGQEFLVSLARRDVVAEYEGLCAEAGSQAGVVDLATFNVINAVLASAQGSSVPMTGDWLLVNAAPEYASLAILRGPDVIFFRNRPAESDGSLLDVVHQAAMYYEDRLQGSGFGHLVLAGASNVPADLDDLRRGLEARFGAPIDTVDPRGAAALTDRIIAAPALLDTLAPLVGVLLRSRPAAGATT